MPCSQGSQASLSAQRTPVRESLGRSNHLSHMPTCYTNSGCGKRGTHRNWSVGFPKEAVPVTQATYSHRYAIARPDKLGTDLVAVDGIDGLRRGKWKEGEEPTRKHQIQPECKEWAAVVGRDGQTCLAGPNSQSRTETGEIVFLVDIYSAKCADSKQYSVFHRYQNSTSAWFTRYLPWTFWPCIAIVKPTGTFALLLVLPVL